ncbi:UDP-N-acetylglucosamine--N-acetylmuramyl-(pentapeptide) pyrophosphoryl-undecaprenol N-acetylglucosamine transferase [Enhygromyxa salina]|uniref:UDP-N-acetylglucosamine--N-acetylmuramyl-(pentapeptide) pyrophosphoryl-undecaprenol N-acetylglucosamine transferase n=1 Tax=Enhygromyxa salina TaxID=215803 RepID=A0A0C2A0K0_9BACT|nr:undecaprenyldiphospho-muramoylpentapeptide beta-N-acetylglucosaminyltransferase [Enhygromyxa salina]KIG16913.1 UDP-N-acetylglucosamine--N-acetylmuramyl-(pentapeptide) pyrophosphoryl-undecaprenol N-acetylglucosamine transferase [Enhygromyxa salina]
MSTLAMSHELTHSTPACARPLRVMIAGGGTGGHLFPGIALAEQVMAGGGEVRFVGTERGIEARVVPELGYGLDLIEVSGIKGRGLKGLISGLLRLPKAWLSSRRLIRAFNPDVVVGVGGYASGPIVATAWMMRRPTAILEQNSVPGITNRILGKLVRRVFTSFPDHAGHFPARKLVRAGNPIRAALVQQLEHARAQAQPAAGEQPPRLFVFGGSQGAQALNTAMIESAAALAKALPGLEIWHQTGTSELERVRAGYASAGLSEPRARVVAFIKDMSKPYAWCDLVLCRAGATSLSELAAVGCPAVLVPFPHATDDHQTHNAMSLVEVGAARMVAERELDGPRLVAELTELLGAPKQLADMRDKMLGAAKPRAAADICRALGEMV